MILKNTFTGIIIGFVLSCANSDRPENPTAYKEIEQAQCLKNANHTFHYSIPVDLQANSPLIIAIDAKGRGELAVQKLLKSCAYTPAIIVGSDMLKNGYPNFEEAINDLINTVNSTITTSDGANNKEDDRSVYLVGFSGGGRMAFNYARNHEIKGVVMIGAGPGSELPKIITYAICGTRDFNFMEIYRRPLPPMLDVANHLFDHFEGGHEWPDSATLTDAMLFNLAFNTGIGQQVAEERALELMSRSDTLLNMGSGLLAWKCLEKAYKLSRDENLRKEIKEKCLAMQKNDQYRVSIRSIENYLKLEMNERQRYIEASMTEGTDYWKNEIKEINERSMFSDDSRVVQHNYRMKGFLGILFYGRLKSALFIEDNLEQAKVLIDAFSLLEPKNSDMFYFRALYHTEVEQMDSASHYLALARQNGLVE